MIDNDTKVIELMAQMKSYLPISTRLTEGYIRLERLFGKRGRRDDHPSLKIHHILYGGDESGILCNINDPAETRVRKFIPLTYLDIDRRHPLSPLIRYYQHRRTRRLQKLERAEQLPQNIF